MWFLDKFLEFAKNKLVSLNQLRASKKKPEYYDLKTIWDNRNKRKNPPTYDDLENVVETIVEQELDDGMRKYREK